IVTVLDTEGHPLADLEIIGIHGIKTSDRTMIVQVQAEKEIAGRIAGIRVQEKDITEPMRQYIDNIHDDTIVCRCEHITAGEIRDLIRKGYTDMNEIKIVTRAGMGACGAKTCDALIHRLFKEEGVPSDKVVDYTKRPLFVEVPLEFFAGVNRKEKE
ncbi:MAG: sulfurtransferase, partial [Anaerolineaceae bacterium]|nr:sulfurtransferase [Anaerolineaceae bacterium]